MYFFLFFYLIIIIRSLYSDNLYLSLGSSAFYFRFLLFSLATVFFLDHNKKFVYLLKYFFIIIFCVLFFDTMYQYYFLNNIFGMKYRFFNESNFRLTSLFGDRGVLGSYISRFFPFIIALFFFEKKNSLTTKDLCLIVLISIISLFLVILSGERTSVFLFFLSFLIIFFTSNGILKKIFKYLLILNFLISIVIINFNSRIYNRILSTSSQQLGINIYEKKINIFGKIHEDHFRIAYKMFKENPIFGKGVKMFRDFCSKPENYLNENACSTHPHHTYVQLLAETGLVGFFFIFFLFIIVNLMLIKNFMNNFDDKNKSNLFLSNYNNAKICLLTSIFLTLSPFNPSGNFFNNWLSIIYFFPIGFLFYLENIKKQTIYKNFLNKK